MINLDKKKTQLELKHQLITLLSDPSVKITRYDIQSDLKEIPSLGGWKLYEKDPRIDISLGLFRKEKK